MRNSYCIVGFTLTMALVLGMGCRRNPPSIPKEDRYREFGKDAFVVIKGVDRYDRSNFLLGGIVGIKDGQMTHSMPGAVLVVGVPDDILVGDKWFTSRQIILLTSEHKYILAPPGMTVTIPGKVEVFGKTYKAGKFRVPKDSKMPRSR